MKRNTIFCLIILLSISCSRNSANFKSLFLSKEFYSFYQNIDTISKIDNTKQIVFIPNDAPASLKYIETKEGEKYCIGYSGSLGKREIKYFFNQNDIYIEDINILYNKDYRYKEDTTKFAIIKQDTIKYFIHNSKLVKYSEKPDSILINSQIMHGSIQKSNTLLKLLEKIKKGAGN